MIERATVTAPEMIGLLVWWIVVLAAPVILVLRWRRRRKAAKRLRRQVGRPAPEQPGGSPVPPPSAAAISRDEDRSRVTPDGAASSAQRSNRCAGTSTSSVGSSSRHLSSGRRLAQLPAGRWRVEPYPLTGERRNTLLVLGETGVFVISATYSPGDWDDVVTASRLAAKIQTLLPGYCGRVHSAICHPFSRVTPRVWHRADDHGEWIGAWLIGGDSVIEWLQHFGAEHGLGPGDLARFDALSTTELAQACDAGGPQLAAAARARRNRPIPVTVRTCELDRGSACPPAGGERRVDPFDLSRELSGDVGELPECAGDRAERDAFQRLAELGDGPIKALPLLLGPATRAAPGRSSWESCMLRAPGCGRCASPSWSA